MLRRGFGVVVGIGRIALCIDILLFVIIKWDNMAEKLGNLKNKWLQIRISSKELESFEKKLEALGMNSKQDKSNYIRAFIKDEKLPRFTPDEMEAMKYYYTNLSRIGGLLNQMAHVLNIEDLKYMDGTQEHIRIPSELDKILNETRKEFRDFKEHLVKIGKRRIE